MDEKVESHRLRDEAEDWSTPPAIETAIRQTVNRMGRGVDVRKQALRDFQEAKRAFKKAEARAVLEGKGSVEDRKRRALIDDEVDRLHYEMDIAEAALQWAVDNAYYLKERLDAQRSTGVSIRSEYQNTGR